MWLTEGKGHYRFCPLSLSQPIIKDETGKTLALFSQSEFCAAEDLGVLLSLYLVTLLFLEKKRGKSG